MFSQRTERQGEVGDLGEKSREELQELLLRQEKILSNKGLVQTLPDKGEKIKTFVQKVLLAIEHRDEEERRQSAPSSARTELQPGYQQAFTMQQHGAAVTPAGSHQDGQREAGAGDAALVKKTSPSSDAAQEMDTLDQEHGQFVSTGGDVEAGAAAGASLNSDETEEDDLAEALERVRMSDTSPGSSTESKDSLKSSGDNYFLRRERPKKPHYITLLEKAEKAPSKQKFKTNELSHSSDISPSGSLSARQFPERPPPPPPPQPPPPPPPPLSAQTRRERDRKHLDDITSARLPPFHKSKLLPMEESFLLLQQQTKRQHELQVMLAAQKLSEGSKISMESYAPHDGPAASYREVHDDGAGTSSEED